MKIFKAMIFLTILFFSRNECFSQEISILGGLNLSRFNFTVDGHVVNKDYITLNPGLNIGSILEFPLNSFLSLETGMTVSEKGHRMLADDLVDVDKYLTKISIFYDEIPVLLKASFPIGKIEIYGKGGAYASCAMYGYSFSKREYSDLPTERKKSHINFGNKQGEYDRFDYGLTLGVGVKIGKMQIGSSYESGFNDNYDGSIEMKNRVVQLYVMYQIANFKK